MKRIRTEQDLIDIARILNDKYDAQGIHITIPMPSYNLKKLDQYLFKKFNPGKVYTFDKVPDEEVVVNIAGITFELKGNGNYEKVIKKDEDGQEFIED